MDQIFYWVLNMSIIASAFGILIYAVRFIKRIPKFVCYVLWAVVLIRLLCPVGISSEFSLLNILSEASENAFVKTIAISSDSMESSGQFLPEFSLSNTIQKAETYHPITYKTNILNTFFTTASIIWAVISAAAVISVSTLYFITKSELKNAMHMKDNIYEGAMVSMPAVYGIVKPKIVLPPGIAKEHLDYILAHERVHIRRRDNLWRMLAILAVCIHWFNPLSWLFLKSFFRDCELSCDEAAIKAMNSEDRKRYALTLLAYAAEDRTVLSSAFGSSKVKVRINNILSYKKLTLFSTVCFAGMIITIAILLLTNAKG